MTIVEEIVEGILYENGIDLDHPVYEHLYEKVEDLQDLSYELVMEHIHGEQIDELSDGTLRSYMDKNSNDRRKSRNMMDKTLNDKTWNKHNERKSKRTRGQAMAIDRVAKNMSEDYRIDELSDGTLKSYIRKSGKSEDRMRSKKKFNKRFENRIDGQLRASHRLIKRNIPRAALNIIDNDRHDRNDAKVHDYNLRRFGRNPYAYKN